MQLVSRGVARLSYVLHLVAGAVMVGLMLMIVANIVGRTWFGLGVAGAVELTQLAMIGIVYLGFAHAYQHDDHVTVDLLYTRLPRAGKVALDLFSAVLTVAILAVLASQLLEYRGVLEAGGRVTHTLRLPLHPVGWVAIAGSAIFAVAVVVTAIDRALGRAATDGAPETDPPTSER